MIKILQNSWAVLTAARVPLLDCDSVSEFLPGRLFDLWRCSAKIFLSVQPPPPQATPTYSLQSSCGFLERPTGARVPARAVEAMPVFRKVGWSLCRPTEKHGFCWCKPQATHPDGTTVQLLQNSVVVATATKAPPEVVAACFAFARSGGRSAAPERSRTLGGAATSNSTICVGLKGERGGGGEHPGHLNYRRALASVLGGPRSSGPSQSNRGSIGAATSTQGKTRPSSLPWIPKREPRRTLQSPGSFSKLWQHYLFLQGRLVALQLYREAVVDRCGHIHPTPPTPLPFAMELLEIFPRNLKLSGPF